MVSAGQNRLLLCQRHVDDALPLAIGCRIAQYCPKQVSPSEETGTIAFSSESLPRERSGVGTGSREENASKQKLEPRSDPIRTDQALNQRGNTMERIWLNQY